MIFRTDKLDCRSAEIALLLEILVICYFVNQRGLICCNLTYFSRLFQCRKTVSHRSMWLGIIICRKSGSMFLYIFNFVNSFFEKRIPCGWCIIKLASLKSYMKLFSLLERLIGDCALGSLQTDWLGNDFCVCVLTRIDQMIFLSSGKWLGWQSEVVGCVGYTGF